MTLAATSPLLPAPEVLGRSLVVTKRSLPTNHPTSCRTRSSEYSDSTGPSAQNPARSTSPPSPTGLLLEDGQHLALVRHTQNRRDIPPAHGRRSL
ncbi:hypothetical protein BJV78DRAFT_608029 [Lactifluus subvellereus]|nr:hypothetical protein BJV78DRAFT_608029 [Lactifluus subvellereus]